MVAVVVTLVETLAAALVEMTLVVVMLMWVGLVM
jgi:hypothetical protein